MKVFSYESSRFVIERAPGSSAITVAELIEALTKMPNGWQVTGIANRDDRTTIVNLQSNRRIESK